MEIQDGWGWRKMSPGLNRRWWSTLAVLLFIAAALIILPGEDYAGMRGRLWLPLRDG